MEQSQYRQYRPHLVASTSNPDAAIPIACPQSSSRNESSSGPPFFKNAQWSPDGTTILTSTADKALNTFILPQDLLSSPTPQHLSPYTTHQSPEPVYATAFHPAFSLENSASALYAASLRALPIRLLSPFSPSIIASYPLVSITTEEYIAPHSLLFSPYDPNTLFAGSLNLIATFDINRNGEGPVARMPTIPSKRSKVVGGVGGIKGIVSALGMSSEGILAAGTFSRWIGLYDGQGRGGSVGAFEVREEAVTVKEVDGNGVTQVAWSNDGRYLCVAERCSDQLGVWDIRGTGKKLASLRGRNSATNQRMSVELVGNEVWAGGVDGMMRSRQRHGITPDPSLQLVQDNGTSVRLLTTMARLPQKKAILRHPLIHTTRLPIARGRDLTTA
ncbi:MAG: hypothetical protein LQ350_000212 [Teloschistes chrysophthalmus]|nr:MAG: hypothetical protein LQ350_000212 [Niorma chrysophthalma]